MSKHQCARDAILKEYGDGYTPHMLDEIAQLREQVAKLQETIRTLHEHFDALRGCDCLDLASQCCKPHIMHGELTSRKSLREGNAQ